jgi:mannose-6-phosphate isomerase-like protein (cupin superfamily)
VGYNQPARREPTEKIRGVIVRQSVLVTATLLSSAACACAFAQRQQASIPADADTVVTAEQLQTILKSGPKKDDGKPGSLSTQLFGRVGSCSFIRIVDADTPHAHGDTSEIYVIQSGTASIETGGEMVGPFNANSAVHQSAFVNADGSARAPGAPGRQGAPGGQGGQGGRGANDGGGGGAEGGPHNGSGTAVAGGRIQVVKAGDVIMIPAGVPHHWVKVDEPIVYLDIKFPKPKS